MPNDLCRPKSLVDRVNDAHAGPVKQVDLENEGLCWVDADDYEEVSRCRWWALRRSTGKTYVVRTAHNDGKRTLVYLHRHLLKPKGTECVDHIDGDPLNNSRSNLRITDKAGNARNRRKGKTFKSRPLSSPYKGVTWDRHASSWKAQIMADGVNYNLGRLGRAPLGSTQGARLIDSTPAPT